MADAKISQLTPITGADMQDDDLFVAARPSSDTNFSVTRAELFTNVTINDLLTVPRLAQDTIDDLEAEVPFGSVVFNSSKNELNLYDGVSWISLVSAGAFDVATDLFGAGETGVYIDANDISTLFQDTAGSTPVTTPGQTVARANDKSGNGNHATQATTAARPTFGIVPETGRRNLLTHTEEFDNAVWVKEGGISVTQISGQEWEFNEGTSGSVAKVIKQEFNSLSETGTAIDVKPGNASPFMRLTTRNNYTTNFLDFNLLTGETFTNGVGFSSVEFNVVALEDGYFRLSINAGTVTDTARSRHLALVFLDADRQLTFTGTGRTVRIRRPQRELGQATSYQRVGTQFDVTEAGVPSLGYLFFDGVDDFLQTPTITPNTDKAQVFAGFDETQTATAQTCLIELSAGSGNGRFLLHRNLSTSVRTLWQSTGTASASVTAGVPALSGSGVLTGLGDISGDIATLRIDGTQVAQSTGDQGTGNYLAYPMFIGARAGTSLRFNGHIHQLITRFGPNLPTADIEKAERYVAIRTAGVTL